MVRSVLSVRPGGTRFFALRERKKRNTKEDEVPLPQRLRRPSLLVAAQSGLLHEGRHRALQALDAAHNGRTLLADQRLLAGIFVEQPGVWRALESAALRPPAL